MLHLTSRRLLAASAVAALLASSPAAAVTINEFSSCDGYGRPTVNGDGMTKEATSLGGWIVAQPGNGDTSRDPVRLGQRGAEFCDQALQSPLLLPQFWMRRVSLLRAKAFHLAVAGDSAGARASLDAINPLVPADGADVYYSRSLRLGADLLRAYLDRSANPAEAVAAIDRALVERPYARSVQIAAMAVLGERSDRARQRDLEHRLAQLQPTAIDLMFIEDLDFGDWQSAVALFSSLTPRLEESHGYAWTRAQAANQATTNAKLAVYWAVRHGQQAFALAMLGHYDDARSVIARGRAKLVEDTTPPPGNGRSIDEKRRYLLTLYDRAGRYGGEMLDYWSKMVERRELIATGRAREAVVSIRTTPMGNDFAAAALMTELKKALPGDPEVSALPEITYRARPIEMPTLAQMFENLPDAETHRQAPSYGSNIFGSAQRGGSYVISFAGAMDTPGAMVEECALLRAADTAIAKGKHGFVILDRSDVRTFIVDSYAQATTSGRPAGYETRLEVALVDLENLPEPYRSTPWRVINADDVIARLRPLYVTRRS
ncbi:MAG: hypothetical protein K1X35_10935 [Caulobacteraceae bacterium]|nr:hypothetical protein [Caulobacteraceae bacterium]